MIEKIQLKNKVLVVGDDEMKEVLLRASRAAQSNLPVLLCGESGTGKELIARFIHEKSMRHAAPFIAINCAAIPEGLMEAELFGYEKGSFTGALFQRIGKFELASGGTLLLDEISEMPYPLQAKLLRVLQEGEIDRIGARDTVKINVRVIATSNKKPEELVAQNKFREDLYYRLNVIRIDCPALRGRPEAIETLIEYFLCDNCRRSEKGPIEITEEALVKILSHSWPGNVRELENVIERAIVQADGRPISQNEVSFEMLRISAHGKNSRQTLSAIEKETILEAITSHGGNRTDAARELGISVRTLRNKLKEYRQE